MSNEVSVIYENDVNGCHVVVEQWGENDYAAYVSYKSYNSRGDWVASPTWSNRGGEEETKSFIQNSVERANQG